MLKKTFCGQYANTLTNKYMKWIALRNILPIIVVEKNVINWKMVSLFENGGFKRVYIHILYPVLRVIILGILGLCRLLAGI